MARANPDPGRIPEPIWQFWLLFDALEPTAQLGGILALKPGYHSHASRLPADDYSISEVAADKKGSRSKASAIDLTMSAAAMVRYTKRLDVAARAKDKRLYIGGVPIIREFIGTKDNRTVYCWMLTGGRAQGVGADAGPDYGRDGSHRWHVHLSVIRQFCESADAMERLFSVMSGESLAAWEKRHAPPVAVKPKPTPVQPKPLPGEGGVVAPPQPAPPVKAVPPRVVVKPQPVVHKPGSRELSYKPGKEMKGLDCVYVQKWIGPARAGKADGVYGPGTRAAVIWFQKMRGLKADGLVGADTWRAMKVKPTF